MIIAFISNYLNHHQLPLALSFYNMKGVDYYFLAVSETPDFRLKLGYQEMNDKYPFVIKMYESSEAQKRGIEIIKSADIFICGDSNKYINIRLKAHKKAYKFTERLFKIHSHNGFKYSKFYYFLSTLKNISPYNHKNVIYLAASFYLKNDLNAFFKCKNTILRWGYFPSHIEQTIIKPSKKDGVIRLLFVGRFIDWKHPEIALYALSSLPSNLKSNIVLTYVGDGDMLDSLQSLTHKLNLSSNVIFKGSLNNNQVREEMSQSDIFFFTSDYQEGWGAVLSEAMDSKCACLASIEAGSSNFLINDRENGLLVSYADQNKINLSLLELINNEIFRDELAQNAYLTIKNRWNANIAAHRLIDFDNGITFDDDVCSKIQH